MSDAAISLGQASRLYASTTWTRLKRGRLLWVCAVLLALPLIGAAALALGGHWGRGLFDELLEVYFRFLLPFVPALLASPAIAEEIESRTYTFVFARPASRAALVLGKFFAVVVPVVIAQVVAVAAVYFVALARFPSDIGENLPHLAETEAAMVLGTLAYASLALALGSAFTRHPFVAVMGYLVIVEAGLGSAPIVLNLVALSWHLRNLAGLPLPDIAFMALHVPAYVSACVATLVSALCLFLASVAVTGAEYGK
jgi:ABC-type transport system involved in multi-copper enzyme maturation permease subunit